MVIGKNLGRLLIQCQFDGASPESSLPLSRASGCRSCKKMVAARILIHSDRGLESILTRRAFINACEIDVASPTKSKAPGMIEILHVMVRRKIRARKPVARYHSGARVRDQRAFED